MNQEDFAKVLADAHLQLFKLVDNLKLNNEQKWKMTAMIGVHLITELISKFPSHQSYIMSLLEDAIKERLKIEEKKIISLKGDKNGR